MIVWESAAEAQEGVLAEKAEGRSVAFVPTMGALHAGHLSLVRRAQELADTAVASIFVNPTQFGPNEDFQRYPRDLDADCARLESEGVSAVFAPEAAEMYPEGFRTVIDVEGLSEVLEGAIRPGHFRGVATVVAKLFHIVPANVAVFGQKDYQQFLVLRRMVRDLNMPIEVVSHPTVREADGLAMSSRNRYLKDTERRSALALSRALAAVRYAAQSGVADEETIEAAAWEVLDAEPSLVPDYAVVVDPDTLEPLPADWTRAVCLVAGRLGSTRLIDNTLFSRAGEEIAP